MLWRSASDQPSDQSHQLSGDTLFGRGSGGGPRPLEGAALGGHVEVVRLLLERGADPALVDLSESDWEKVPADVRRLLRP
jgi:hypothetical protein